MEYEERKEHNCKYYHTSIDGADYDYYPTTDRLEIGDNWDVYWSPLLDSEEIDELYAFLKFIIEKRKEKYEN